MPSATDVTLPSDREVRVTRAFDAPRDLVFECHTEPELIRRWMLGPPGWSMPVCEVDLRVGGRYHYVWRNDEDGSEFGFRGRFLEIDSPGRIRHTERPDDREEGPGVDAVCTLELSEQDGRTTLTQTIRFPSREIRDQVLETGMTDGMGMSYDRLEQVMVEQKTA